MALDLSMQVHEFTLFQNIYCLPNCIPLFGGWKRFVIRRQFPSGFGIRPIGDICNVEIGIFLKEPNIRPSFTSFCSFNNINQQNCQKLISCLHLDF
jgi:hypothetical protein